MQLAECRSFLLPKGLIDTEFKEIFRRVLEAKEYFFAFSRLLVVLNQPPMILNSSYWKDLLEKRSLQPQASFKENLINFFISRFLFIINIYKTRPLYILSFCLPGIIFISEIQKLPLEILLNFLLCLKVLSRLT